MIEASSACFELIDPAGLCVGSAVISTLPSQRGTSTSPALVIAPDARAAGLEPVQLLEGSEYLFEIDAPSPVQIDKSELFVPDDLTGRRGRVRTRLYTGRVDVRV